MLRSVAKQRVSKREATPSFATALRSLLRTRVE
jgi:hypothetical protein